MAILDHRGNPIRSERSLSARRVSARYDAAQTSSEYSRHWAESDSLSARSANSPEVRAKLRNRSRYEVANNSWASGVADALADFMVGPGPILQLLTVDGALNRRVEREFSQWGEAVGFADKLWTLRRVRAVDGEGFLRFDSDAGLGPVTLDLREYEAEEVATPYAAPLSQRAVDGIELSASMRPEFYHFLYEHPGDSAWYSASQSYARVPAANVVHFFRATRPKQYRGVPEFTQSLGLFANLRRYRDATIAAAETAADFAAVLYSEMPPDGTAADAEPFDSVAIEKRTMTTLPAGWKLGQFKAEQPGTGHPEFVRTCLTELATGHGTTYEVASGDYSQVNYSSGKLAQQRFLRAVNTDRARMERTCLNRILRAWLDEAVLSGLVPEPGEAWAHRWLWPAIESIDPQKDATAAETRLATFTTTFSEECYQSGVDPEARADEIARDVAMFRERGLPSPYEVARASSTNSGGFENGQESEPDPGDSPANAGVDRVHRNGFARS